MNAAATNATITSVTPQALLQACTARGLNPRRILQQAGIEPAVMMDSASRIPAAQVTALWHRARHAAGDDAIAVEAAEQLPMGAYRVFDYLLFSSRDGLDGLLHVVDSYPLLNEAFRFSLTRHKGGANFVLSRADGDAQIPRLYVLFIFATVLQRFEHMMGAPIRMPEIRLTAPADDRLAAVHQWFDGRLRFGQPRNEIVVDAETLARPSLHADPALCEVLEEHARRLMRALPSHCDLARAVRAALADGLRLRVPGLSQVAAQLAVSPRSLQRRLAEQGSSFRQMLDDVRRERCRSMLQQRGVTFAEVSHELGFSEPSAFHRAFRRWTGMTPGEFLQ